MGRCLCDEGKVEVADVTYASWHRDLLLPIIVTRKIFWRLVRYLFLGAILVPVSV